MPLAPGGPCEPLGPTEPDGPGGPGRPDTVIGAHGTHKDAWGPRAPATEGSLPAPLAGGGRAQPWQGHVQRDIPFSLFLFSSARAVWPRYIQRVQLRGLWHRAVYAGGVPFAPADHCARLARGRAASRDCPTADEIAWPSAVDQRLEATSPLVCVSACGPRRPRL